MDVIHVISLNYCVIFIVRPRCPITSKYTELFGYI